MSNMLTIANHKKIFSGIVIPYCQRELTHLQFTDDVILFIRNDTKSIQGVKRVLQCFQMMSGLGINFQKSSIYGFQEDSSILHFWASLIGCKVDTGPFTYLGATIGASVNSIQFWNPLKSNVKNKLEAWDATNLSMAGRLVLFKAAMDSLPIYWFSLYRAPEKILKDIEQIRRSFLWGKKVTGNKNLHLLRWE